MAELVMLDAHDALPDGRVVTVMQRLDEDDPDRVVVEIALVGKDGLRETTHPVHPDGRPMSFEEAIAAARGVADSERLPRVFAVDRAAGPLEQEVLAQGGAHDAKGRTLSDDDLDEGEPGPDMRR
jgi:hypothetical protein